MRTFEVWIVDGPGSLTADVHVVRATSERDAYRQALELAKDRLVRGVIELDEEEVVQ